MKTRTIAYWTATSLVAFAYVAGGAMDLALAPDVVAVLSHLGYPAYLAIILGGWKLLGALAILWPGVPRLKEWAYAGIAFHLTGAVFSHVASGDAFAQLATPLVVLALATASWALRPASRTLAGRTSTSARTSTVPLAGAQPGLA